MAERIDHIRDAVAEACRVLAQQGLVDYLGHISARVPGQDYFVVSPRGSALGGLYQFTAADMMIIDADGRKLEGEHEVPSEVHIHTEVMRVRDDVNSVVHTHQPMAVAFGVTGRVIRPVHVGGSDLFRIPMPVYDNPMSVITATRGRRVAQTLGSHSLLHLRGHGVVAASLSVEQVALSVISLEQQARHNYYALQLGQPKSMSAQELRQKAADLRRVRRTRGDVGRWRYYVSLLGSS